MTSPYCSVTGQPGADPYSADPSGKVALIDRGGCAVSLKIDRAAKAGATAVLIGLVAPGDAVSFSIGGGDTFVPSMVITQDLSESIKANIAAPVIVSVSDAVSIKLVGSMVGSSSRGPSIAGRAGVCFQQLAKASSSAEASSRSPMRSPTYA